MFSKRVLPAARVGAGKQPLVIQEPSMAIKVIGLLFGVILGESLVSYYAVGKLPRFT